MQAERVGVDVIIAQMSSHAVLSHTESEIDKLFLQRKAESGWLQAHPAVCEPRETNIDRDLTIECGAAD